MVEQCEVTYTMLSTLEASEAVYDAPDGVLAGVSAGKSIVDCATLSPERMLVEEAAVKERCSLLLLICCTDAPVSGLELINEFADNYAPATAVSADCLLM